MLCALRILLDDVNDLDYIGDSDDHLNLVVVDVDVVDVVHPAMLCALRAVLEACELLRLI